MHFSPDGLEAFRKFLKSEFSEENVEFWLACEDFKKTKSSTKITLKAQRIYSDFIEADAPKEVNTFLHILWVLTEDANKMESSGPKFWKDRKHCSMWFLFQFYDNRLPGGKHCETLKQTKISYG